MTELHFPEHLPAVLIGVNEDRAALADALPWAHTVHHQHGGYACLQSHFYGILLPLSAVPGCSTLTRGFEALAHDSPTPSAFEPFPELESLHLTFGEPYDSAAIHVVQRFLARADFDFPAVTGGTEALLEFSAAEPTTFLGWPVLMLEMPEACPLHDPDAPDLDMGPLGIYPGKVLSQPALAWLQELVGDQLRVYLLWDNSD